MTGDFRFDWARGERTGIGEAVLCDHKNVAQLVDIIDQADERQRSLLLTRMTDVQMETLGDRLAIDPIGRTGVLDHGCPAPAPGGVAVACAGTSDVQVAREAVATLSFYGIAADLYADIGVAGLWRLQEVLPDLRQQKVVIAAAGMEGALFSVLAGQVPGLVIAVPTSVGYGVAQGGQAALSSALASCAPGVVTVNVDNGFGAACAAIKALGAGRS